TKAEQTGAGDGNLADDRPGADGDLRRSLRGGWRIHKLPVELVRFWSADALIRNSKARFWQRADEGIRAANRQLVEALAGFGGARGRGESGLLPFGVLAIVDV